MRFEVLLVVSLAAAAMVLSWAYFSRYAVARPPIGVINLWDIALMIGGIILVPYLYLALPGWAVTGLLVLGAWSALYLVCEPLLRRRRLIWGLSGALVLADSATAALFATDKSVFLVVNNLVMILLVVGISNLWAQSGMQARAVTLLGAFLIVYDLIATSLTPLMGALLQRLAAQPLAPQLAWPIDRTDVVAIGVGDVLVAAVFPLVLRRAFGEWAGIVAIGSAIGAMVGLSVLPLSGIFPVMVVLGPLMALQYTVWRWRYGSERTTYQYHTSVSERITLNDLPANV
jgi:hypothetical protein